jgi:hypothetical protein
MERAISGTSQRTSTTGKLPQPVPGVCSCDRLCRRTRKILDYYSRLGVNLMCEKCPRLRGHLANEYDDELISKVLSHIVLQTLGTLT